MNAEKMPASREGERQAVPKVAAFSHPHNTAGRTQAQSFEADDEREKTSDRTLSGSTISIIIGVAVNRLYKVLKTHGVCPVREAFRDERTQWSFDEVWTLVLARVNSRWFPLLPTERQIRRRLGDHYPSLREWLAARGIHPVRVPGYRTLRYRLIDVWPVLNLGPFPGQGSKSTVRQMSGD